MANEDIDHVILRLSECPNVEIRDIKRRTGIITIKAENLTKISEIIQILRIELDTKFYINHIGFI